MQWKRENEFANDSSGRHRQASPSASKSCVIGGATTGCEPAESCSATMIFDSRCEADILRLVDEYPLAWVVSAGASGFGASPLPILAETDSNGRIASLVGHVAIANPQVTQLRTSPLAAILFMGPHGYIAPELG